MYDSLETLNPYLIQSVCKYSTRDTEVSIELFGWCDIIGQSSHCIYQAEFSTVCYFLKLGQL